MECKAFGHLSRYSRASESPEKIRSLRQRRSIEHSEGQTPPREAGTPETFGFGAQRPFTCWAQARASHTGRCCPALRVGRLVARVSHVGAAETVARQGPMDWLEQKPTSTSVCFAARAPVAPACERAVEARRRVYAAEQAHEP